MGAKLNGLIGVVVAVGGFGAYWMSRNTLDTADADRKLKAWAEENLAPVKSVDCPKVKLKKGTSFECKVDFVAGQTYQLAVDVKDDDGNVEYHWTKPVLNAERMASMVAGQIKEQQHQDVTLDCGKGLLEVPAAGAVCTATSGGKSGHLRVKVDMASKDISWTVEP